MAKIRAQIRPPIPRTAEEALQSLPDSGLGMHFLDGVVSEGETALIFMTDKVKRTIPREAEIAWDGTFFVVPGIFQQLFTIFAKYGTYYFPIIHALMTSKAAHLYNALLERIKEDIDIAPISGMSDYEQSSRAAFSAQFPTLRLSGCSFHFMCAVHRKALELGLKNAMKNNQPLWSIMKRILHLCFLKAEQIEPAFNLLKQEAQACNMGAHDRAKFNRFCRYVKRFWFGTVGVQSISVFGLRTRTNNWSESYHSMLKKRIKTNRPSFWNFVIKLYEVQEDFDADIDRVDLGLKIRRNRRAKDLRNEAVRVEAEDKLERGLYTPMEFLARVSHTNDTLVNRLLGANHEIDPLLENDFEPSDDENDVQGEAEDENTCNICTEPIRERCTFVPCGHTQFCHRCALQWHAANPTCPFCRQATERIIRLH